MAGDREIPTFLPRLLALPFSWHAHAYTSSDPNASVGSIPLPPTDGFHARHVTTLDYGRADVVVCVMVREVADAVHVFERALGPNFRP